MTSATMSAPRIVDPVGPSGTPFRMWTLAPLPITVGEGLPDIGAAARQIEAAGWDGMMIADNQCLWGETFVALTQAALATDRLLLGTSATNPGTRHPALQAGAAAAVAEISHDRLMLGIARGDSALAYVGSGPVPIRGFDAYLKVLRTLLDGGAVDFEDLASWRAAPSVTEHSEADAPTSSRLQWVRQGSPPVPLMACVSGERAIAVAARHSTSILFGLGAHPDRLRWGMRVAREACERAGRDPESLQFGTVMHVGVSDDIDYARALVAPGVAAEVRFSCMTGRIAAWVPEEHIPIYEQVASHYDMTRHGNMTKEGTIASHVDLLPPQFIDGFAIVGSVDRCVERLHELFELGIRDVLISQQRTNLASPDGTDHEAVVAEQLLPAVRAAHTR